MKIIYLVGPSGSGKSKLCESLVAFGTQFVHVSLDKEVKRIAPEFKIKKVEDWDTRWAYCKQVLTELGQNSNSEQAYLIDTGAGALQTAEGRDYFLGFASHMICLNGNPKVIYERNCAKFIARNSKPRSYTEFYQDEYSSTRQGVYGAARITIDTVAMDEQQSLATLRKAIEEVLADYEVSSIGDVQREDKGDGE